MENAIHFEHEAKRIRVSYRLSVDGIDGVELRTVLEAMDVSCFFIFHLLQFVTNFNLYFLIEPWCFTLLLIMIIQVNGSKAVHCQTNLNHFRKS